MISVCIATYNGEKYIKEQLESILYQLSEDDEVIISDDGSKDRTINVIEELHDKRVKIYHNSGLHGFTCNFSNALRYASGDYIFLSDQDDIWKENKVHVILKQLKQYDLVCHNADLVDGEGDLLGMTYFESTHNHKSFFSNLWKTRWLGCCMAFRRNVLEYCMPIPNSVVGHDYWIGMLSMLKFKYVFLDVSLLFYRRHGGNASSSSGKSHESWYYKVFKKRLRLLILLSKKIIFDT